MKPRQLFSLLAIVSMLATTAHAADPAEGEADFKRCKACHAIVDDADTVIMKGGKTGPNLYGVIGRTVGTVEGFKYGKSLVAVGEAGTVWTEENLAAYIEDPKSWLAEILDDPSAKTKMTYKHKKRAAEMAAFLGTHGAVEQAPATD